MRLYYDRIPRFPFLLPHRLIIQTPPLILSNLQPLTSPYLTGTPPPGPALLLANAACLLGNCKPLNPALGGPALPADVQLPDPGVMAEYGANRSSLLLSPAAPYMPMPMWDIPIPILPDRGVCEPESGAEPDPDPEFDPDRVVERERDERGMGLVERANN